MKFELVEISGSCWIVSDNVGKWYGREMLLCKSNAKLLLESLEHANAVGHDETRQEFRKVLGLKW